MANDSLTSEIIAVLLACLLLAGCIDNRYLSAAATQESMRVCEPHGGLKFVGAVSDNFEAAGYYIAYCNSGNEIRGRAK